MTAEDESKVGAMHKKTRMELRSALTTANNDNEVCAMNKDIRIAVLKCTIMTVESERQVCEMHKYSRMELGCAIMTVESKSKIFTMKQKNSGAQ